MSNSTVNLFRFILQIEDEENLFDLKLGSENIWEYFRMPFISRLMEHLTGVNTVNKGEGKREYNTDYLLINDEYERRIFDLDNKDLLIINHPRRVREGNNYRCVITDELVKNLECSYYVLEDAYKGMHFLPHETKNLKYRDVSVIEELYHYKAEYAAEELYKVTERIVEAFEKRLLISLGGTIKNKIYLSFKNIAKEIFLGKKYARILLKMISPKAVIVTVWYSVLNQTLISEAKVLGIPTIDLQHGRIGDTHTAYNYLNKRELRCFPDYLFVYGEYERSTPNYPIDLSHVIKCGNPELERRSKMNRNVHKGKVITFISNPADGQIILQYALYFINYAKKNNLDWRIIYKLHPSEYTTWEREYPQLLGLAVEIVADNNHDIYYFLERSQYIVSISSTTVYEAMLFNTNIIILQEQDYIKSKPVYENGYAVLVKGFDNFCNCILNNIDNSTPKNTDFYYERNAVENMKNAIKFCIAEAETKIPQKSMVSAMRYGINEEKIREYMLPKKSKEYEKYLSLFILMRNWFAKKQQGRRIVDYLVDKGYLTIGIYGVGDVGMLLYEELKSSPIEIKYGIDQENPYFFDDSITFKPEDNLEEVDAIIVTAVYYYPEIKKRLQRMQCPVLSLADIVSSM